MADQTQRLEIATVRAEVGSNIVFRFANDAENADSIPTQSGDIQNLKQVVLEIQQEAAEKVSISTTIYPTVAAGLAATVDQGIFLVQSNDADEIYTVWQNQGGIAVNTGKTALSSTAIQTALDASNEAARAAEEAADIATSRTAGFLAPSELAPAVRDNGLPLQPGDRYFNTIDQAEYIYKTDGWEINDSIEAVTQINQRFSVSPGPGKTPEANDDGKIIIDWLPETVARKSDLDALIQSIKGLSVNVKEFGAVGDGITSDTVKVQDIINSVSSSGGGVVYFPRGNFLVTGLKVPGNVCLVGAGASATFLSYAGGPGSIGIEFIYRATSYNLGGFSHLTPYNIGSFGGVGVLTPANTDAFTRSQRWLFTDFAIRGISGCETNLIIGDSASSSVQRFFIQGPYIPQNTDEGQPQDTGILLKGVRGVVNADISGYKIRGIRTGVRASDFAEGFHVCRGEIVGSWEGIVCDSKPSKPGGFIDNNHLNCVYRGIRMERRRHITLGINQFYRDSSFSAHGLGFKAIEATNCAGLTLGAVQTRIGTGFADEGVGVSLTDTKDTVISEITGGESATLTKALQINASATEAAGGITLKGISGETISTWVEFTGPVSDFRLADNVNERGIPSASPIVFNGGSAERSSIKLPAASTAIPEFSIVANRNSNFSRNVKARVDSPVIKESLVAGSGPYVGSIYLDTSSAVLGDKFTIILRQIGGSNSTFNLYSGASGVSPTLIKSLASGAAGVNNFRVFVCYFIGSAWEIHPDIQSAS